MMADMETIQSMSVLRLRAALSDTMKEANCDEEDMDNRTDVFSGSIKSFLLGHEADSLSVGNLARLFAALGKVIHVTIRDAYWTPKMENDE